MSRLRMQVARVSQGIRSVPVMKIIDGVAKLAGPLAVLVGAIIAQNFQSSLSVSQMLAAREQSDTNIRAEMFKAITEKLLGNTDPEPLRQAVFTELLALNFHENFELKPLLVEVDDAMLAQLDGELDATRRSLVSKQRSELESVVRRVRERQLAMLIHHPGAGDSAWLPFLANGKDEARFRDGDIRMLSVRFTGPPARASETPLSGCDLDEGEPGQSACVDEPMIENAPDGRAAIAISVRPQADWTRDTFTLRIKPMAYQPALAAQKPVPASAKPTGAAPVECGIRPVASDPATKSTSSSGGVEFDVSRFDLPLTDNTPLSTGSRYAMFIDRVCPEGGESGVKTVKFGLVWFPKDFFPPRERPTNYSDLRRKLNVPLER